jgi:pyruvate dehydrogenase E2 component (dihydrolipoamide acetyltransferase)
MARSFKLPDLGEGIQEGEILSVEVSTGDEVKEGDILLEIETDKAAVEVPSPFTGTVEEVLVEPGDVVQVGDILVTFSGDEGGEEEEKPDEKQAAASNAEEVKKEKPGEKEKRETRKEPAHQETGKKGDTVKAEQTKDEKAEPAKEGPVPASPSTRRLARELGVDLHRVTPSGPKGLVTAEDVKTFSKKVGQAEPAEKERAGEKERTATARPIEVPGPELPDFEKWGETERIPVKPIRRATARQMALSWSQIPHVANYGDVDLTRLETLRQKHRAEVEDKGGKLTLTVFAMKAAVSALKVHPNFNASLDMEKGEIIRKHYYHIGVAVATDDGLIVPVLRDVDQKSIMDLSIELRDLVERTRSRKVKIEEMQGGSFTITNVGPMGGSRFSAVINYPQVAILGMGSAGMQPVAVEKAKGRYDIVPRLILPFVLCIDHRILDGADAIAFMQTFKQVMQDPEEMLMMM